MGPRAEALMVGAGARKFSSGPKKGRVWGGHLSLLRTKNEGYMA